MALLANYHRFTSNPLTSTSGAVLADFPSSRSNWNRAGQTRNRFYGENTVVSVTDTYGLPAGYMTPYSWIMPTRGGGMGSNTLIVGSGELLAMMVSPIYADLVGSGSLSAIQTIQGWMVANIFVNESQATTQQIVDAVWGAVALNYNATSTMGEKLNIAADPWITDLTSYTTPCTAGQLMKKASKPKIAL